MSTPAQWGAIPVESPAAWGAVRADAAPVIPPEKPSVLARIGRGIMDVGQGINQGVLNLEDRLGGPRVPQSVYDPVTKQSVVVSGLDPTAADYTKSVNEDLQRYSAGQGKGIDWARALGAGAASAPAALLAPEVAGPAWLARAIGGATAGAVAAGSEFTPTNSIAERAKNAAIGAATGGIAAPVSAAAAEGAGKVFQAVAGRAKGMAQAAQPLTVEEIVQQIPSLSQLPAPAQTDLIAEAHAQLKQTGAFNAQQLERKANLLAQGITPTKSMITRDPADWSRERNLQKLSQSPDESLSAPGRDLTSIYEGNDAALAARLNQQATGLPAGTAEAHGMTAMKSLDDLAKMSQKEVSDTYDSIRTAHGDELASDAKNVVSTLNDPNVADNAYAEPIINSVTKRLKRLGMVDETGAPTSNTMTVGQADEFRKFLQTLKSGDPKTDRVVGAFIKATDQDVLSGAGADVMAPARASAAARFATLENPATQRAINALGELNQGKTAQNFIQTNVISGADQDVASLLDTLGKLPPDQAQAGTNAIKAGVIKWLQEKAVNPKSGQFSGSQLSDALTDLGDPKLARIFGMKSAQELKALAQAGVDATYQPAYSAVNVSNTAPMLLSLARHARSVPGVPLLVSDEAQKAAARIGYASQLKDIRAAQAQAPLAPTPELFDQIAGLLPKSAGSLGAIASSQESARQKRPSAGR